MKETNCPYAFMIRKGTFEKYTLINMVLKNEKNVFFFINYDFDFFIAKNMI